LVDGVGEGPRIVRKGHGYAPPGMGLQQFEQRLERLVEGVFAKAFRSGVQPVELGRRLAREMDLHRTVGVRGIIAPNHFRLALSPSDHERFASFSESLTRELADAVREHARDETYGFVGPVEITIEEDSSLGAGEFLVASELVEAPGGARVAALAMDDGHRVVVADQPVRIGRQSDCEIVLTDPNVSRHHAEVKRDADEFVVADLGSTNGTKVNGQGIKKARPLSDGDEITVGTTRLRFEAS
jgi:hypothetical protein